MSSAVVSTSAALGRPFLFDAEPDCCHPERSGKCAKRIPCGVEGSLPSPDPRLASILPASRLEFRPAPEMVTSGIPALDALTGGLPRGCLTEICGPTSSGRTTVLLAALAAATRRGEYCAVIDASDALDPHSLAAAGTALDHLLWVRCGNPVSLKSPASSSAAVSAAVAGASRPRFKGESNSGKRSRSPCDTIQSAFDFDSSGPGRNVSPQSEHRLEQVLRATDLLLESGGFGLIILDLADLPPQVARRIPLTTWFRFRRAVEHKPTILLAIEQQPIAGSCSSLLLQLGTTDVSAAKRRKNADHGCPERSRRGASRGLSAPDDQAPEGRKTICVTGETPPEFSSLSHAHLLTALEIHAELIRSRLDRKPSRSITFETKTAWAG